MSYALDHGTANYMWRPRDPQHTSTGTTEVLRVLDGFRQEHGWEPGMVWNPYAGAYEWPEAS